MGKPILTYLFYVYNNCSYQILMVSLQVNS
jgi:hypothetical protein